MATLTHSVGVQWPLVATFEFTMADAMKTTSGVLTNFKATAGVFGVIPLPYDAIVLDGVFDVIVVSNDTGTSTVKVGNSVDNDMWSDNTTIDLKTLGRTKLMKTGTVITAQSVKLLGESVLLTIANNTGDATTGQFRLAVEYVIGNRQTENAATVAPLGYLV
jgi:hypothetical protein